MLKKNSFNFLDIKIIRFSSRLTALREIFPESYQINPKSDCIYHPPIDLDPNGRAFGSKSIGKW